MMSQHNASAIIDVNIFGRQYVINVGDQDYQQLLLAIDLLNQQFHEVALVMPAAAYDKVAMIASLNMAYQLLTDINQMHAKVSELNKNFTEA